jgi:CheY-like chemotaxis protein
MYKIAVVDDDRNWCFVIERFFRNDFEIFTFTKLASFLRDLDDYDLVIVDYYMPPANYEKDIQGCEVIRYLKKTLPNPPLLVLASGFISKNDSDLGNKLCSEADAFFAKDAGLEELLQQTKQLLASRSSNSRVSDRIIE